MIRFTYQLTLRKLRSSSETPAFCFHVHYDNYEGPQLLSIFITLLMILTFFFPCQKRPQEKGLFSLFFFLYLLKESFSFFMFFFSL